MELAKRSSVLHQQSTPLFLKREEGVGERGKTSFPVKRSFSSFPKSAFTLIELLVKSTISPLHIFCKKDQRNVYSPACRQVKQRCFTLIELLVVIAIIAILAAILLPALNSARERGRSASCISNLKQIATAAGMYADGSDEFFPTSRGPCPAVNDQSKEDVSWAMRLIAGSYITSPALVCTTFATVTTRLDRINWLMSKSLSDFRSDFNNFKYIGYGMNYKVAPYDDNEDFLPKVKRNQIKASTFLFMDMFSTYELAAQKNYGFHYSLGRLPNGHASGHYGVPAGLHGGKITNTAWVDGHVTSEKTAEDYTNAYKEYEFGKSDNWKTSLD